MGYKTIQIDKVQIKLHRHLMEQKIGRKILRGEVVYHKNGDKMDNSEGNLILISRRQLTYINPQTLKKRSESRRIKIDTHELEKINGKMPIAKIADHFGVSHMTIRKRLIENNLKTNHRDKK